MCPNVIIIRNKQLSFYVIPKNPALRKIWLSKIILKNFKPTTAHSVCSAHFEGGKKTYDNNIPTIVPTTVKPSSFPTRTSRNSVGLKMDCLHTQLIDPGLYVDITTEEKIKGTTIKREPDGNGKRVLKKITQNC